MAQRKPLILPPGWTIEQLEEELVRYARMKRNQYNAAHPQQRKEQRIRASINFLRRCGFVVMQADEMPAGDPWEWTPEQQRLMMDALKAGAAAAREAASA